MDSILFFLFILVNPTIHIEKFKIVSLYQMWNNHYSFVFDNSFKVGLVEYTYNGGKSSSSSIIITIKKLSLIWIQ